MRRILSLIYELALICITKQRRLCMYVSFLADRIDSRASVTFVRTFQIQVCPSVVCLVCDVMFCG